jgi:hypothetical protein
MGFQRDYITVKFTSLGPYLGQINHHIPIEIYLCSKIIFMIPFSEKDIQQANQRGIKQKELIEQWNRLRDGFPFIQLDSAAIPGYGIHVLDAAEKKKYTKLFEEKKEAYYVEKFVPASGAATRMFQPVRSLHQEPLPQQAKQVLKDWEDLPFASLIKSKMKSLGVSDGFISSPQKLAQVILEKEGLGYGGYPKGLVPFDVVEGKPYSAFQEQLDEARKLSNGHIHFTVSPEYLKEVKSHLGEEQNISFSVQEEATDYIARTGVEPVRDEEGQLLFRPSGHGALIQNLNQLQSDLVFINNIDNILPEAKNGQGLLYKQILGGLLIELKEKSDTYLKQLTEGKAYKEDVRNWIHAWFNPDFKGKTDQEYINQLLRPIRVAGMVKNEGKAGGGPFWVKSKQGKTLQIVEGAQIDPHDSGQQNILKSSTHFNPVNIVCALKDYKGNKFDLTEFIDPDTGFDSAKNINGKDARIIERPGLWNGSMSGWNTVFIDVPVETFNPVKSVLDLLKR